MRRSLVAAMLALLTLAWPAQAQLFPSTPGAGPTGLSPILDVRIKVSPGARTEGHCIALDPGKLEYSAQIVGDPPHRTVELTFYRVRGGDDHFTAFDQALSTEAFSRQGDVVGGLYCYGLVNKERVPAQSSINEATALGQDVALRVHYARSP